MEEFERIIEFSFNPKQSKFVVRFLSGNACVLAVEDLPKKMQTKKPAWEEAYLSTNRDTLIVRAGNETREIPSHIIHAKGKEL